MLRISFTGNSVLPKLVSTRTPGPRTGPHRHRRWSPSIAPCRCSRPAYSIERMPAQSASSHPLPGCGNSKCHPGLFQRRANRPAVQSSAAPSPAPAAARRLGRRRDFDAPNQFHRQLGLAKARFHAQGSRRRADGEPVPLAAVNRAVPVLVPAYSIERMPAQASFMSPSVAEWKLKVSSRFFPTTREPSRSSMVSWTPDSLAAAGWAWAQCSHQGANHGKQVMFFIYWGLTDD